jgi:hypothetical protein
MGWSESISLTSRILTRSPTVNRQSIAALAAPLSRSTSIHRMLAGVVSRLTATMSSSHSMPPPSPWPVALPVVAVLRAMAIPGAARVRGGGRLASGRLAGSAVTSSFMPHCGQRPGWSLVTSGCIGQAYRTGPCPGAAMSSISATKASVLSGGAASQESRPCRSPASSGAWRSTSNWPASDGAACSPATVIVASR